MALENKEDVKIEVAEEKRTEMPDVEELLKILLEVNVEQNRQTVHLLMNYMNDIEENFFSVLEELDAVKAQLSQVQNTPQTKEVRHTLSDLGQKLQGQVAHLQEQMDSMKMRINEKAAQLVQNFKDQGVAALHHVCEFLGIKESLIQMRESMLQSAKDMQASMDQIDKVAGELRAATTHVKNAGRAAAGKSIQEVPQPKERGFFYQMKRPYQAMQNFCMKNVQKLDKDIGKLTMLKQQVENIKDRKAGKEDKPQEKEEKTSIMEKLQVMKAKQEAKEKTAPVTVKTAKQETAL